MRAALLAVALVPLACTPVRTGDPERYQNPPACEPLVAEHAADPGGAVVDSSPTLERGSLPPPFPHFIVTDEAVVMELVVNEFGGVEYTSIQISGLAPSQEQVDLRTRARRWLFRPARVGECWVPGVFRIEMTEVSRTG